MQTVKTNFYCMFCDVETERGVFPIFDKERQREIYTCFSHFNKLVRGEIKK